MRRWKSDSSLFGRSSVDRQIALLMQCSESEPLLRAHEIGRSLLAGPDGRVIFFDTEFRFGIVDELRTAYIRLDTEGIAVKEYSWKPKEGLEQAVELEASIFQNGSQEQPEMGLNKRIHTELNAGNGRTLSRLMPEERAGWQSLIAADASMQLVARETAKAAVEQDDAIESMGLELRYTGTTPTIPGQYLVVDALTESRRFATVPKDVSTQRMVRVDGSQMTRLEEFLKPSQRWFLIPPLNKDDLTMVRELPLARRSAC